MKGKPAHDSTYAVEGILLKMERLKQGKGQKEVCYGICVPSYLSKIEHAAVCPEREILAALFDRLGIAYEKDEAVLSDLEKLTEDYFYRMRYWLDTRSVYDRLKAHEKTLRYSRYAIEWLLIKGFENRQPDPLLRQMRPHMDGRQNAYYQILCSMQTEEADGQVRLCEEACAVLQDSYALGSLCEAYFNRGNYTAIHALEQRFVAIAVEEGNTAGLAKYFFLNGTAYACLHVEEMMMLYYERYIRLLQNTGWKDRNPYLYYNMGAALVSLKKYDEALVYLEKAGACEGLKTDILHKKAIAYLRMGKKEEGKQILEKLKKAVFDAEQSFMPENTRFLQFAYQELALVYAYEEDFKERPEYLSVLEKLTDEIRKTKHFGYLYFYKDLIVEAYKRQRKYKKALEFEQEVSRIAIKNIF